MPRKKKSPPKKVPKGGHKRRRQHRKPRVPRYSAEEFQETRDLLDELDVMPEYHLPDAVMGVDDLANDPAPDVEFMSAEWIADRERSIKEAFARVLQGMSGADRRKAMQMGLKIVDPTPSMTVAQYYRSKREYDKWLLISRGATHEQCTGLLNEVIDLEGDKLRNERELRHQIDYAERPVLRTTGDVLRERRELADAIAANKKAKIDFRGAVRTIKQRAKMTTAEFRKRLAKAKRDLLKCAKKH